jgi:uncharacterized membrane protein
MKTISWRIWATLITFLVTWIMVRNIKTGLKVGVADTTIKFFTYYIHDFVWLKLNVIQNDSQQLMHDENKEESKK